MSKPIPKLTPTQQEVVLVRVPEPSGWAITAYEVMRDGNRLGYVWKREGFSYRGTGGWNSGIRIEDFHPIEWHYGECAGLPDRHSYGRQRRRQAVDALLAAFNAKEKA